ncbi:MAG TPA: amidohydrolase family protein, partial [Candidatus Cloacimonas sp.]|nr:amidohydrolase family protein [Candidatus Cloacimonas sp.]
TIAPAKILNLPGGILAEGKTADLTIIDLEKETLFSAENILSKSKNTPWLNQWFPGRIMVTICDGKITYLDSENG